MSGKNIILHGKLLNDVRYEIRAPMEGPSLGYAALRFAAVEARLDDPLETETLTMTLDQLDALCSRLRHVHTCIEHIKKHGLAPVTATDGGNPATVWSEGREAISITR